MPDCRIKVGFVVNPLIRGSRAKSKIPSKSAPSAKILIVSGRVSTTSSLPTCVVFGADPGRRLRETRRHGVGPLGRTLVVPVVDEDRATAGPLSCFNVAPPVDDHVAS